MLAARSRKRADGGGDEAVGTTSSVSHSSDDDRWHCQQQAAHTIGRVSGGSMDCTRMSVAVQEPGW